MLLTNLGAVGKMLNTRYKRKLKGLEMHRGKISKNFEVLQRGSTRLAQYSNLDKHHA